MELRARAVELHDLEVLHRQRVHVVVVRDDPRADVLVLGLRHLTHRGRAPIAHRGRVLLGPVVDVLFEVRRDRTGALRPR